MTVILWDIDGVLNPSLSDSAPDLGFLPLTSGWASWQLNPTTHGLWMKDLESKARMVWCSAWEESSNDISLFFGNKKYEYVPFRIVPPNTKPNLTWKLPAVKQFLKKISEPAIWLDDEFEQDAYDWAATRPNTLLITCDPKVGWTYEQYKEIQSFIAIHDTKKRSLLNLFRR